MDKDNYLENMRKRLEKNRQDIRAGLFNNHLTDLFQRQDEDFPLNVYPDFEPETKAKVGTFNRMVNGEQRFQVKAADYDCNTNDYSPLVNLLGGILEVEGSLSIWQLFRRLNNIEMPEYYGREYNIEPKTIGKTKFELHKKCETLGTLLKCCEIDWKSLPVRIDSLPDSSGCLSDFQESLEDIKSFLKKTKEIRNDASHGRVVDENRFKAYYEEYKKFYQSQLVVFLELKKYIKEKHEDSNNGKTVGSLYGKDFGESKDAMSADEYISLLNTMFEEIVGSSTTVADDFRPVALTEKIGIILTDTECLANKYACAKDVIDNVFTSFIVKSEDYNQYWKLLDMSEMRSGKNSWYDYNHAVSQFIIARKLNVGLNLHLLIVGGLDVVPCEIVTMKNIGGNGIVEIPTDFCYAFTDKYLDDFLAGRQEGIGLQNIRNTVSRLPLQNGSLSHYNIEKDLGRYFANYLAQMCGIRAKNVVMVTNKEWLHNSDNISRNIPLTIHTDDPDITYKNMYVSPKLNVYDASAMKYFRQSYSEADMLLFNLHGSKKEGCPGFYGHGDSPSESYLAFSPEQIVESNSKLLFTVACYGARYANYSRDDSMLMTALYRSGVLAYIGSQISVPMFYDYDDIPRRALLFGSYSGSEVLLRMWTLYCYCGEPVGCAYFRALCDYFNKFRHIESDDFALRTILMFSLYGNPMLTLQQSGKVLLSALEQLKGDIKETEMKPMQYRQTETKLVYDRNGHNTSLLDRLRGIVDSNFESIHNMVESNLYRTLGLPPRQLETVSSFSRQNTKGENNSGYLYNYHNPYLMYANDTVVEVDKLGKIKRVYTTK